MPHNRYTAPKCMGRRMLHDCDNKWTISFPELSVKVVVDSTNQARSTWLISVLGVHQKSGVVFGRQQAAATAAQNWLVERARLTLAMAGER